MKKIITYSVQNKIIPQNFTEQPAQLRTQNQNQNHTIHTAKPLKKKLTNDRQEIINNISASGFKQFQV